MGAAGAAVLTEKLEAVWWYEDELLLGSRPKGPDLGRPGEEVQMAAEVLGAVAGVQLVGHEGRVGPDHAGRAGCEAVQSSD